MKKVRTIKTVLFAMVFALFLAGGTVSASTDLDKGNEDGTDFDPSKPFEEKSDEEYTVELTQEQAIKRTVELTGKSEEEVRAELSEQSKSTNSVSAAATCSWLERRHNVTVKSYDASLIVMPQFCRSGSFGYINTDKEPLLQEFDASQPKSYSGSVKVDLRDNGYYWYVNGKFYNNTDVTHTGTTGISAVFTATYSVSSTSNYYGGVNTGLVWEAL